MLQRPRSIVMMLLLALVAMATALQADVQRPAAASDEADRFARMVQDLTTDAMEGRGVGTAGLDLARDYLLERLELLELDPVFRDSARKPSHTQPVEMSLGVRVSRQSLAQVASDAGGDDRVFDTPGGFRAMGFSASGRFEGEAVFVGYGIVSPERGYDSYAGLGDGGLTGRVAIAFRYEPMDGEQRSRWARRGPWSEAASLPAKAAWAAERGAVALLVVDPPNLEATQLRATSATVFAETSAIPVMHIRRSVLESVLAAAGRDPRAAIRAYQRRADGVGSPPDALGVVLRGEVQLQRPRVTIHNVAGIVPGSGALAEQTIVVGAHYDHLGYGEVGSLAMSPQPQIHPGADDNASGVAALLLLAERWRRIVEADPNADRRAVAFVFFSGEERGLIGSAYMVNNPRELLFDLDAVTAMINLDMVGRMEGGRLWVFGSDTADDWRQTFRRAAGDMDLRLRFGGSSLMSGGGSSDHASFFIRRIPAVHLFTGTHEDYHRPSDTAEKINPEGGVAVVELTQRVLADLTTRERPQRFAGPASITGHEAVAAVQTGGAFLGVVPDYASLEGDDGCRITGVLPDSPADRAGLRAGDTLLTWNDHVLANIRDLTARLAGAAPGDEITMTVQRGDERLHLQVQLGARGGG
jgi:hypothetical protein